MPELRRLPSTHSATRSVRSNESCAGWSAAPSSALVTAGPKSSSRSSNQSELEIGCAASSYARGAHGPTVLRGRGSARRGRCAARRARPQSRAGLRTSRSARLPATACRRCRLRVAGRRRPGCTARPSRSPTRTRTAATRPERLRAARPGCGPPEALAVQIVSATSSGTTRARVMTSSIVTTES